VTWSILARDDTGRVGVAIASRFFAVGGLCVASRGGVGIVATQALCNPTYGPSALALLATGRSAAEVVRELTAADGGASQRQLHVLPWNGPAAAHTGADCIDWCGHLLHDDCSVAGNMLASESVITETARIFHATAGRPLAVRLLRALQAGDAAGGDKRGRQSAALRVQHGEDYPELDLRVDDHEQPFLELERLHAKSLERFQAFASCLPTRARPDGVLDRTEIEAEIDRFLKQRSPTA
jgi:uncharacterized Ntn-hydrolase superfamily protein